MKFLIIFLFVFLSNLEYLLSRILTNPFVAGSLFKGNFHYKYAVHTNFRLIFFFQLPKVSPILTGQWLIIRKSEFHLRVCRWLIGYCMHKAWFEPRQLFHYLNDLDSLVLIKNRSSFFNNFLCFGNMFC